MLVIINGLNMNISYKTIITTYNILGDVNEDQVAAYFGCR